jgi:hypothetical protein
VTILQATKPYVEMPAFCQHCELTGDILGVITGFFDSKVQVLTTRTIRNIQLLINQKVSGAGFEQSAANPVAC